MLPQTRSKLDRQTSFNYLQTRSLPSDAAAGWWYFKRRSYIITNFVDTTCTFFSGMCRSSARNHVRLADHFGCPLMRSNFCYVSNFANCIAIGLTIVVLAINLEGDGNFITNSRAKHSLVSPWFQVRDLGN